MAEWATKQGLSFGEALRRVDEIPGLATRSANQLRGFAAAARPTTRRWWPRGCPADAILTSVLERSGYLARAARLQGPAGRDPAGEPARADHGGPGVRQRRGRAHRRRGRAGRRLRRGAPTARTRGALDPETDLAAGAAEPDDSLGAFLERVALVADSDQIPDIPGRGRRRGGHPDDPAHGQGAGVRHRVPDRLRGRGVPAPAGADRPQGAGRGAPAGLRRHHPGPAAALHHPGRRALGVRDAAAQPAQPVPGRGARPPDRLAAAGVGDRPAGATPRRPRPTSPGGTRSATAPARSSRSARCRC